MAAEKKTRREVNSQLRRPSGVAETTTTYKPKVNAEVVREKLAFNPAYQGK